MPSPATVDEFLDLVQKSGVAEDSRLKSYLQKLASRSGVPADPSKLAATLVRDGILTYFQADQLLQGKWKRFFIGKYKVLERLGAGGMGQVFLCEHKLMRRRVAVKVLPAAKAQDPASLERFYREARAVAALDHPNIVRAYDIDQDDSLHFLVMEYVDGTNLQDLVKKSGVLDFARACHYVYGTAVGLQHAHEMGLVHRDIKPANILVDRSGVVKILDMGLARFFNDEDDSLTKKYDESILGTADYLAPEQAIDSHSVDIRADLYSLGATFYFLLTGQPPFPEGTVAQKLLWHQTRQPAPVRSLRPDAPPDLTDIIGRMMEKDLFRRFQTPAELMNALAQWVLVPIPPPTERELPQMSPAAMSAAAKAAGGLPDGGSSPGTPVPGGSSTRRQAAPPATGNTSVMPVDPYPSSEPRTETTRRSGYPTPYPDPPTALPSPVHYVPAAPAGYTPVEPPTGQWANLAAETRADERVGDTQPRAYWDGPPADAPVAVRPVAPVPPPNRRRFFLWGSIALLLFGGAAGALAFVLTRPGTPAPAGPERRWYVTKSGTSPDPDRTLTTLRGAVEQLDSGDVIVLLDDTLDDPPVVISSRRTKGTLKNVRIEPGNPAKSVTWTPRVPPGGRAPAAVLDLQDVEDAKVSGLVIDAGEAVLAGVAVSGASPGTVVENVTVRNPKQAGFRFANLLTDPTRPVRLTDFRAVARGPVEAGILVVGPERATSRALVVQNGILVGPGGAGLKIQGTVDVEMRNVRAANFDYAVLVAPRAPEVPFGLVVAGNTFHALAKGGVAVEASLGAKQTFSLTKNLFSAVRGDLLQWPGNPTITAADNARDAATPDGRLQPRAVEVKVDLPAENPDDTARFLIPPPGSEAAKFGAKPW